MEWGRVYAPCGHFEASMPAESCCQNCGVQEEEHTAGNQEPRSPPRADVPYCDLPSRLPASEHPAEESIWAPAGLGSGSGPERGLLAEHPRAAGSSTWDPEALPYLEGLISPPGGSFDSDEDPDSTTSSISDSGNTPDGTSSSSLSVDQGTVERQEEKSSGEGLPTMIPRKLQDTSRVDSARGTPSVLARSSVCQRKEDPGGGCPSAGQRWAKLRGESSHFLERHRPAPSPATCTAVPGAPRSATTQTPSHHRSALRDAGPAASTPPDAPQGSSPTRLTPWDKARALVTQRDVPKTPSTQHSSLRAPSPSRTTQRDDPRASAAQRGDPQVSSPARAPQQEHSRTLSSPQENPPASFPHPRDRPRTTCSQQDHPSASSPSRTPQRESSRTSCAQSDHLRASSPNRTHQKDNSRTFCGQRDNPRASSPNRASQREHSRTACGQRDNPSTSPPNRTPQRENPRTSCPQRDTPRASPSPNRATQRENPRTFCGQRDNPGTSSSSPSKTPQRDNPRTSSCAQRLDNPRAPSPNRTPPRDSPRNAPTPRDTPKASSGALWNSSRASCTQRDTPQAASSPRRDTPGMSSCAQSGTAPGSSNAGPASPRRGPQQGTPRNHSPHRTNKDIPWASFPLRPTQGEGTRTSTPAARPKQSEVPWASIALRPTQGTSTAPAKSALGSSGPAARAPQITPQAPGSQGASPLHPVSRGPPQFSLESSPPPCAVCIGHRDAPRATSPPRHLQHDPFPFFPDPHAAESDAPHHEPPNMPPAVCIGHRDAPRASSPPRHAQFDPFPFLPDTGDSENVAPQHDPPQFPPFACIGYRDAPRALSPPRHTPEPTALLFQDLPRASTESLGPSTDPTREAPHMPGPVCIGHRDAPSFSSPPRQPPELGLGCQDPPGASSMESLAPSTDSLWGSPGPHPQVCIGHRDAPRASSPPRHPPSDLAAFLASSPPPPACSSGGSRGSVPPGETRHNLEREEYTVLADLPPPRRRAQREPGPQGGRGGRTPSPGRAEVERLFGQERRKSEAPGAFQAREEGHSRRPGPTQSQLQRRQSSPALCREVTPPAEPARLSRRDPPPRSPERERRTPRLPERDRTGPRQPVGGRPGQEHPPGCQDTHRRLERSWSSQEEDPSLGGWQGLGDHGQGAAGAPEGAGWVPSRESEGNWGQLGGPPCHREHSEAWEGAPRNGPRDHPQRPAQRGWGSLQELFGPPRPRTPPDSASRYPASLSKSRQAETPADRGDGGVCPHQAHTPEKHPEFDWRDLMGLLGAHAGEPPGAPSLPRLCWDRLLELLQAPLARREPEPRPDSPGKEPPSQPAGGVEATMVNGHSPAQRLQSPGLGPGPASTSTQWPNTQVSTGGADAPVPAGLEETPGSPVGGPRLPEGKLHSEEPEEEPEPSRGPDSPEQKQADSADKRPAAGKAGSPLQGRLVTSWRMPGDRLTLFNPFLLSLGVLNWQRPDLLNFKKGWMSILDEPGEWKKHWFVLTDSSLKYYRDSSAEEADELDGEIDLRTCTDVTEFAVQRNYGFQIHTKDAVYTLSAMTSGIRRNWIEALRKTVRPTSAPDVTKLSDNNKENTLHSCVAPKGSLRGGEPRGVPTRKADGQRPALDYVELSPLSLGTPQRARTSARSSDRPTKPEELERFMAQRSEERRKWFDTPEPAAGEAPRRDLGAPLTEDQQTRLSEEIEKKWQELEKLPLREGHRVPLSALLNQGRSERRGAPTDNHEALEREVQSLRAQLEMWRLRGETSGCQEDTHIPPGYISQEACERSLAEMESSHQQLLEELQRHHERELQRLQQEKDWLLAEETAATASAIEAVKKAYKEELSRELSKTQGVHQGPDGLQQQHQSDVEALKRELQVLSEQYSQKCLEIGALTLQAEEREHTLRCCQQEGQELQRHNQDLHARLSEEIDRLRSFIASQGSSKGCGERSSCELEVLLRVKENELQYLKKEVQSLRDELQMLQKDKRFTSGKYQDVYVELNHIKTRSEREIEQLKEHLRLATAALRERDGLRAGLAD